MLPLQQKSDTRPSRSRHVPNPVDSRLPSESVPQVTHIKKVPDKAKAEKPPRADKPPSTILVIDIGGSKIKMLATGQTEPRKMASGKSLTPARMIEAVQKLTRDWEYEAVSIGIPCPVGDHGPRSEPGNLGAGWVGFNYADAFGHPVRILNDAAMQALGSYEGGRMLFLGLGTGLGSTLIAENVIIPLELGQLLHDGDKTVGEVLGKQGLEKLGKDDWRKAVKRFVTSLTGAFLVDYVVLGGGNAKKLKDLMPGIRLGHNLTAFRGGFRLWNLEDVPTTSPEEPHAHIEAPRGPVAWRLI
jgi:polyphosphate glucokinase